ncbi:MAG TPA: bifunctional UDP-N-acetylglucosamine diphosphorylase/glucosamine-1-phosphate N-acetyltransferase GlmU [Actinomycetota bacterium]
MPTKSPRSLAAVVMAAGLGKRLKSRRPKVLHEIAGRPVLWHVLRAAVAAKPKRLVVVVHHGREEVEEAVRSWSLRPEPVFVDQGEPLGTGHAVLAAERAIGDAADVLVLPGDEPLVTGEQVRQMLSIHRRRDVAAVVQTTIPVDARGFARVIRDARGEFVRLAEGTDATPEELRVTEAATSVYVFRREDLFGALPLVTRENRQREYYLPDVLGILHDKGERIAVQLVDSGGSVGANSRQELAQAAEVMRTRINERHMDAGVSIVDPATTFIGPEVRIGADTVIHPMAFLEGTTRIGRACGIGPSARIVDSTVGDGSTVQFAVVRGSRIGRDVNVGPFASLRPDTVLEDGSKAGTFVEIKGSRVGKGSKVPHLSYVGDADIGKGVNVGAATVTVNYDGWEKHRTVIGDDVKIGSDTMLVAPVRVGKGAMTGAGSVITKDVPPGALGIERSDQRNIEGFRARQEDRHRAKSKGTTAGTKGKGRG